MISPEKRFRPGIKIHPGLKSNQKASGYPNNCHATIVPVVTSYLAGQYCSIENLTIDDCFHLAACTEPSSAMKEQLPW